ncbi:LOW QUALITY PROTEIN: uncharacterized protein LOC111073418 [Drosophila obscura]|uniref:LOW QUALITY PROTEIN: uncharacterized protein LOC111073418 n=1 Tax=Drosophila obscura TaxID=7282 RepID=UPI001BB18F90|nr:LOW QUALITY PROTEIN: uncharacterized protein LOC111073418 [Drosophila obscura]
MDPNRHHEYQTHHQQAVHQSMPLHHQTHPHPPHHQQQQQQHLHHPPPAPQQQQPQHHLQQQQHPNPHPRTATTSYGSHNPNPGGEEQRSRTALYMMNSSGSRGTGAGAQSQSVPQAGSAAAATATSSSDPHLQYYTSNRDLTAAKKVPQAAEPPHPSWPYKTGQSVPSAAPAAASGLRHHHGNPAMYPTSSQQQAAPAHSTAYWPPPDEQMHHPPPQQLQQQQQQRYSAYGQKLPQGGGTASGYRIEGFAMGQQSEAQQIGARLHPGYAPQPGYGTQPGYGPQPGVAGQPDSRFGNQSEAGGYGTQPGVGGKAGGYGGANSSTHHPSTPTPPTATSTPQQQQQQQHLQQSHHQSHQSLYMPMPQFSTEKFQTTVHNAIEKYVRETPAPSLDYPASRGPAAVGGGGGGGAAAAYGRTTGYGYAKISSSKVPATTSSTGYLKLEPEHALAGTLPQPTRSSLYHNPYTTAAPPQPPPPPPQHSEAPQRERDSSPAMATPPHGYPTKYGKLLQQHGTGAVTGTGTGTGATPYSSYYHGHHGTPSPAAGAVASPTPPAPPPPLASQLSSASSSSSSTTLQVYPHGPDICYQPVASAQTQSQSQSQGHPTAAAKKSPAVAKPNYRALINDMLKRNTASEQELNLQIIKKTLNMEPPPRNHVHVLPAATRVIQQVAPAPAPASAPAPAPAPAPTLYSPLDLSMRTVKQTADSTEYKYQRPHHQTPTTTTTEYKSAQLPHLAVGGGLGLPRFDITASFSAAANRGAGTPTSPAPTAVIRQAPATTVPHLPPVVAPLASAAAAPALVIKSLQQMRPSVLETNPYAKRQQHQNLPPETSIVQVLPKPLPQLTELTPAPSPSSTPSQSPSPSPQHQHNSSNPNYLGRKRHLQEYNQAAAKQARLDAAMEAAVSAPVPVIAVNEQALAAKRERERERELQPSTSSASSTSMSTSMSMAVPKAEPRIRTKAELKGFTFTPPVLVTSTTPATNSISVAPPAAILAPSPAVTVARTPPNHQVTNHIQIKLEPAPPQATSHPGVGGGAVGADLGLLDEDLGFKGSLLDCWGSTCNNLVEQLLSKAQPPVIPACPGSSIKLELSEDDLPVARILKRQPPPAVAAAAAAAAAADGESAATTTTQVTTTTNGIGSSLGNGGGAQKKLSKVEREKKRLQQEQRIAARLAPKAGQSSSSESDTTELHRRTTERQKKPLLMRKGRARQRSLGGQTGKSSQQTGQSTAEEAAAAAAAAAEEKGGSQPSTSEERESKKEFVKREAVSPPPSASDNVQHEETAKAKGMAKAKQEESRENSSSSDEEQEDEEEEDEEEEEEKEKKEKSGKSLAHRKQQQQQSKGGIPPLKNRILNTMTRSKHRKELELQLANSKVLRNDKIIRNSTTKIKRKYVRKVVDSKKEMMVTRLRNKRGLDAMDCNSSQPNGRTKLKGKQEQSTGGPAKSKTSPQQQLYLEEYRYKVALKIPHRLISINKLNKVAASLPDLERRDIGQELACFKSRAGGGRPRTKAASKQHQENTPKSIIDVLHLRVTNGSSSSSTKTTVSVSAPASTNLQLHSETSQTSASNSLYEQPQQQEPPPPPQANAETTGSCLDDPSKRHFSIFDTKVLQSKTRTESKLQQRREIIREIFVGPERPASAPPECAQEAGGGGDNEEEAAISYQKYEEFLAQMNSIVSANDNKLLGRRTLVGDKQPSATQCPHKRKYLRRKGSSGFDYIRKKKRPTPASNSQQNQQSHNQSSSHAHAHATSNQHVLSEHNQSAADERLDDTDSTIAGSSHLPAKIKTEMDVLREIQKWVLNKGVGQSTMHKAARQGLIDVVVYCLDRMHMNPDQKDNAGYTPLHEACTQGWLEIARILLQFGANHSEAAQSGIRPLHGAIENDHEEVVRLLLSYGADPLLATYSGQTPLALASSKLMSGILSDHLSDAQSAAADIHPMRFQGPWDIFDAKEYGYDIFDNVPNTACDKSRALRRERKEQQQQKLCSNVNGNGNGNVLLAAKKEEQQEEPEKKVETSIKLNGETSATKTGKYSSSTTTTTTTTTTMMVKVEPGTEEDEQEQRQHEDTNNNKNRNEEELNANVENNLVTSVVTVKNEVKKELDVDMDLDINMDRERERERERERNRLDDEDLAESETMDDNELNGDIFEFEEADVPLPPLYLLKDEGSDKWVLLNDLCNLLKVKSKDTLLNKLCPNNNNNNNALANSQKQLLREFKIDDFLEKATCLQLLCAGEKLNMFSSSKVVLIKYNDSVKNLLGVKTILMKF